MRFTMQPYTYNNEALDYAIDRLSPCDDSKCEEVKTEVPPCTGSSIQKKNETKFVVKIGEEVELKDGTIGKLIYVNKTDGSPNLYNIAIEFKNSVISTTLNSSQFKDCFNRIGVNNFNMNHNIEELKPNFEKRNEMTTIEIVDTNGKTRKEKRMGELYYKIQPTTDDIVTKINEIIKVVNGGE